MGESQPNLVFNGFKAEKLILERTPVCLRIHTQSLMAYTFTRNLEYCQFISGMSLGCGRKLKQPAKTYTDKGRTCMLNTEGIHF